MSRGRGRGGRGFTFNLESIGIGKGEQLPAPSLAPPPLYPSLPVKPEPIIPGNDDKYLHDVKQSLISSFRSSKYFVVPPKVKTTVQRYSDKFDASNTLTTSSDLDSLDWRLFPEELKPTKKIRKTKPEKILGPDDVDQLLKKMEELEETGEKSPKSEKDESEPEGEIDSDEGEKDEEEIEEDTDYARNYFDNGESFLEDNSDDNLDEGPVY